MGRRVQALEGQWKSGRARFKARERSGRINIVQLVVIICSFSLLRLLWPENGWVEQIERYFFTFCMGTEGRIYFLSSYKSAKVATSLWPRLTWSEAIGVVMLLVLHILLSWLQLDFGHLCFLGSISWYTQCLFWICCDESNSGFLKICWNCFVDRSCFCILTKFFVKMAICNWKSRVEVFIQ
jgi:hypothetical protein